jgi:hypothetical protein
MQTTNRRYTLLILGLALVLSLLVGACTPSEATTAAPAAATSAEESTGATEVPAATEAPAEDTEGETPATAESGEASQPTISMNSGANLQAAASFSSPAVIFVPAGTELPVLARDQNRMFFLVEYEGTRGWISQAAGGLFSFNGSPSDIGRLEVSDFVAESE